MEELKEQYQAYREAKEYRRPVLLVKSRNTKFYEYIVGLKESMIYKQNCMIFGGKVLAHILGVSHWTVYKWAKRGHIKQHDHKRHIVFYFKNVIDDLERNINTIQIDK